MYLFYYSLSHLLVVNRNGTNSVKNSVIQNCNICPFTERAALNAKGMGSGKQHYLYISRTEPIGNIPPPAPIHLSAISSSMEETEAKHQLSPSRARALVLKDLSADHRSAIGSYQLLEAVSH